MRLSPPWWSETDRFRSELLLAASFLTRLPLPAAAAPPLPGDLARAAWAFPVVGAGIGVTCAAADLVALGLGLPRFAAALIAVGAGVLATGALHEDGLADAADACGGSDVAERLAIMRDSRSGSFGVLALIFSVGLRAAAVATLLGGWSVLGALVAAHAVARGALPVMLAILAPARADGLGAGAGRPEPAGIALSIGIAVLLAFLGFGLRLGTTVTALLSTAIVMALIAAGAQRLIGGQTGDVLGAIEQGGEAAMLLAAASW